MSKSEEYYQQLMAHRHVSRRGLFRAFITASRSTVKTGTSLLAHALPPGALPGQQFSEHCTQCGICINACPMCILHQHEDGFPQLSIEYASCDGCGLCITACSEGALRPQDNFDTGLRPVFGSACVNLHRSCKQCVNSCPEQACFIGTSGLPEIDNERCSGCGECRVQCSYDAVTLALKNAV